jgi:PD-(D/E)XK nuclease superfamily
MTPQAILPAHIDSTMINSFRSCHQKFKNEYVFGLRPAEPSIDLHAGAVFSTTLEAFYRETYTNGLDTSKALARAYGTFQHEWGDFIIRKEKHPKTPENVWAAVEDYVRTYPPRSDSVQPYFTDGAPSFEFSFAIPLDFPNFPRHPVSGDPFFYVGRFDMFGKKDDRPVVRDEKTAQRLESNWAEKWDLRSQFLGYCWSLQYNGIPCNTVVIRGVIITLTTIRQVEAVKTYPKHLIDRWFEQLRRDLESLVRCWNDGYFDYNLGDTCTAYSHCPFIALCSSPAPERWYDTYEVRRWNPLARNRNPLSNAPSSIAANFAPSGNIPERVLRHFSPSATTDSGAASKTPGSDAITSNPEKV